MALPVERAGPCRRAVLLRGSKKEKRRAAKQVDMDQGAWTDEVHWQELTSAGSNGKFSRVHYSERLNVSLAAWLLQCPCVCWGGTGVSISPVVSGFLSTATWTAWLLGICYFDREGSSHTPTGSAEFRNWLCVFGQSKFTRRPFARNFKQLLCAIPRCATSRRPGQTILVSHGLRGLPERPLLHLRQDAVHVRETLRP